MFYAYFLSIFIFYIGIPDAPSGIRLLGRSSEEGLKLQWQPPLSNGNSPLTQYIVSVKETGKENFKKVCKVPGDTTTCSITNGLEEGKNYIVRVYAENEVLKWNKA